MARSSPVRSITVRIFIVVTGHTVSHRVKMKFMIVTRPASSRGVKASPV